MSDINIGIDLGTTNSAIVGFDGIDFRVFKNRYQMEVTPSAVMIGKSNRLTVGQKAMDMQAIYSDDVKLEFKRLMGTKEKVYFRSSGKYMTPEELSAEILKSLIFDAQKFYEDEISYAVITIPAAFKALQCESTNKASILAGISSSSLLMEPVAASVGFAGSHFDLDDKWLVYDFGGGTFDVAIVEHQNNILTVIEHSGNNMLGGKNIDEKIIDNILLQALQERYNIPLKMENPELYINLRRRLKGIAESLKIELSSLSEIKIDIYDIGEDLDGKEYDTSIQVVREDIDKIAQPFIQETIYYCNEVLTNSKLEASALSKILLVGGPTQMPILRETLEEEFAIPLDYSIDPMTAVARGAALYCSTIEKPKAKISLPKASEVDPYMELDLSYQNVTSVIDPLIIGEIKSKIEENESYEICFDTPDGFWNSNWIPIENGKFEANLFLKKQSHNNFNIALRNQHGKKVACSPQNITIRHGVEFDDFRLPHTISVKIKNADGVEVLDPIFPRNTSLPAETRIQYLSDKTLLPGSNDSINIVIYEGELFESPDSNEILSNLPINGNEIKRPIPINTSIVVTLNINSSRILNATAYVEILDQEFIKRFVPDDSQVDINILYDRAGLRLGIFYEDFEYINENKSHQLSENQLMELSALKDRADSTFIESSEISETDKRVDPDKVKRIYEDVQKLNQRLYKIKKDIGASIDQDIDKLISYFEDDAEEIRLFLDNTDDRPSVSKFNRIYKDAYLCHENANISGLKKCSEELNKMKWQLRMQNERFLEGAYEYLESIKPTMRNQEEASRLLALGRKYIDEEDYKELRDIIWDLYDLLPDPDIMNKAYQSGIRKI